MPATAPADPHADPAPRVLVVDDDLIVRDMAVRTLRHTGFQVEEADGGAAALDAFARAPFDLVLLDVVMDGIDGFETCRRLRAVEHGRHVPVVMLTGLDDVESIERAHGAGATDFITKPIHWGLLVYRIRYALRGAAALDAIRQSRESLSRAQRMAHLGNWSLDAAGRMRCSEELMRILGAAPEAVQAASAEAFLARVCEPDRERVRHAREALTQRGVSYQLSYGIARFDGIVRTVFEQAAPVRDALGRQIAIEGITHDITERVEAERRIRHLALHDGLTGLPNRDFFLRLAGRALEQARHERAACALLQIDIDRFKSVNDALGNEAGDEVLRVIAQRLQRHTRGGDLAAASAGAVGTGVLARATGNSFTLLLAGIGRPEHAGRAAERLRQVVAEPIRVDNAEIQLTACVGIASFPKDAGEPGALIRFAEQALYAAKSVGPSQQRFFDEAMNAQASARLSREAELRRAIGRGELHIHLQPKIDAIRGRILGAEALVRWQHPARGLIPPGEFIPLAEETGLITEVTAVVLDQVCALYTKRRVAGLPQVPVAVNVAGSCFMADGMVERLKALVQDQHVPPDALVLEVTESMLMKDLGRAVARLKALHAQGFRLSLDDFGTGYSSLAYLRQFPIDELKIDRSFVVDVAHGAKEGALVAAIVTLAQRLDMQVVAEGVETREQAGALLQLGCHIHQGYLYSRPVPVDAFEALLGGSADAVHPGGGCLPREGVHAVPAGVVE